MTLCLASPQTCLDQPRSRCHHVNIPPRTLSITYRSSNALRNVTAASAPKILQDVNAGNLLTFAEVRNVAERRKLYLYARTLGPIYRIVCRDGGENGKILAVTAGFTVPVAGIMHLDTLQVFTKGITGDEGTRIRGGALGLGLIMGCAVFSFGYAQGCKKAELLAINDDEDTHQRLVKYYSFFGFEVVKVVGENGLMDVADQLVWGGVGTRMDADIEKCLRKWTKAVRRSTAKGTAVTAGECHTDGLP